MIVVSRDERNTPRHNLIETVKLQNSTEIELTYERTDSQKRHPLSIGKPAVLTGVSSSNGGGETSSTVAAELGIAAIVLITCCRWKPKMKNEETVNSYSYGNEDKYPSMLSTDIRLQITGAFHSYLCFDTCI